jgi:uncharacterized protein (DUF924 family)
VKLEQAESILEYWFGTEADDLVAAKQHAELWWKKNPQVDQDIRERFATRLDAAAHGNLDDWLTHPRGRLAMIILADQFSRNMYRDTPRSFAFDRLAQTWCKAGLDSGADRLLRPIERVFFNLPLEHSESLEDQQRSVALCKSLADSVPDEHRELFDGYLKYAERHRDIVQRFGRFPHRNAILGRESTEEEIAFLQKPGSSF